MNIRTLLAAVSGALLIQGVGLRGEQVIEFPEEVFIEEPGVAPARGTAETKEKAPHPDSAGEQVLELTDGSQLHGRLVTLGKSELVWNRGDTTEPLIFAPGEVRRIILDPKPAAAPGARANATLKLQGNAWLSGNLAGFVNGKFRMNLTDVADVEVQRGKVEWLYLSPSAPPDAFEGPIGPMGMAGWDTGGGAWDYADGAFAARAATPLTRRFAVLPEKVDIEFTTGDGGEAARGLMLWLQPGRQMRGYAKGSVHLRFQANNVAVSSYDGQNMKNFNANLPAEKNPTKTTRYRILQNRKTGKFFLLVNGNQVAEWDLPPIKDPEPGGTLSWQPGYWSSNMAWTLSKIRVQPWDGTTGADARADEAGKDLLATDASSRVSGNLEAITKDSLKFGGKNFALKEPHFIRLAGTDAFDETPPVVARIVLAQRGEFDVTALGIRDGQLKARTAFSGDLTLPLASVATIEFPHRLNAAEKAAADGGDTLVFRNGDRLRGTLAGATQDQSLKWKPVKGDRNVEFAFPRLASVLLGQKPRKAASSGTAAVRFRNGDWLVGEMRRLDGEHLTIRSPVAENLRVQRADVQTLYFGPAGEVPVWDASADRESWMKNAGAMLNVRGRRSPELKRNPWQYLDGAFILRQSGNRDGSGSGPSIGRVLDGMPEKVEVAFELSTPKGPAGYSVQLFTDENRPGLMIQGGWDSAYIYDMSPRGQAGGFFNQPQQVDFGEKFGAGGNRRYFRFLADRKTGRLVMLVNGVPMAQFGQRPGKDSAKPGKGILIVPQPMNSSLAVSNLWIAPWCGKAPDVPKREPRARRIGALRQVQVPEPPDQAPAKAPAAESKPPDPPIASADVVALANGDETTCQVESATSSDLSLKCDAGALDVPLTRISMVEFAGSARPLEEGIRLRLVDKGTLTMKSLAIEDGKVLCRSTTAGDLSFQIDAVSEIVFQPRNQPPHSDSGASDVRNSIAPGAIRGGVIIKGGGVLRLNGGQIIVD